MRKPKNFDKKTYAYGKYHSRKATGLCVQCGAEAVAGHIQCEVCKSVAADQKAGYRDLRIAKGLCDICGKNPPAKDRISCRQCLIKNSENKKKKKKLVMKKIRKLLYQLFGCDEKVALESLLNKFDLNENFTEKSTRNCPD